MTDLEKQKLQGIVRRKTRQRLVFALVTLALYFCYLFNYLPAGDFLRRPLGASPLNGSLAMFAGLILVFIIFELLFLALNRDDRAGGD